MSLTYFIMPRRMQTGEFTVDQLLLSGVVWSLGQLTPQQRADLNRRARAGVLVRERATWRAGTPRARSAIVFRLPTVAL